MAADITSRYDGNVDDSGQVNWRGDQVSAPQGGQSIYDSSSVQLTELGSRKVVGDRVFRYAKAAGTCGAGDIAESMPAIELLTTPGTTPAGGKQVIMTATAAIAANSFADGVVIVGSGAATNMGHMYKIKSHSAISSAGTGALTLYDPIKIAIAATDKLTVQQNMYAACVECTTAAAAVVVGVAPIAVTTGDYFWLQTWGPAGVKCGAAATGLVSADVTGQCIAYDSAAAQAALTPIGVAMMDVTASEYGIVYLQIAP